MSERAGAALSETELRDWLWLNHGCDVRVLYGDDGERQCNNMKRHHPLDFKRDRVVDLLRELFALTAERATRAQACPTHGDPLVCLACEAEEDARPEWATQREADRNALTYAAAVVEGKAEVAAPAHVGILRDYARRLADIGRSHYLSRDHGRR